MYASEGIGRCTAALDFARWQCIPGYTAHPLRFDDRWLPQPILQSPETIPCENIAQQHLNSKVAANHRRGMNRRDPAFAHIKHEEQLTSKQNISYRGREATPCRNCNMKVAVLTERPPLFITLKVPLVFGLRLI